MNKKLLGGIIVILLGVFSITSAATLLKTRQGGTGQNWGSTATGTIPYFSSSGGLGTLGIGSTNHVLTVSGGVPAWSNELTLATTTITDLTVSSVFNLTGTVSATNDLTMEDDAWIGLGAAKGRIIFDDAGTDDISFMNGNVGIGTTSPSDKLHVSGDLTVTATSTFLGQLTVNNLRMDTNTLDTTSGDLILDANSNKLELSFDTITGPSGQSVTITMNQEGTDCAEAASQPSDWEANGASCAQSADKTEGWVQTGRFQYYTGYSGYTGQGFCGGATTWCDSGLDETAGAGDSASGWNQAQTGSVTLTASKIDGAVKYTWTAKVDWNGNGVFNTGTDEHSEGRWPATEWSEDKNGDTDGIIGAGDQTWQVIDLNNTYSGGSDPDPSDRIVHMNMPTAQNGTTSASGRTVITVKARDIQGTVLASGSVTIDPSDIDISIHSWAAIEEADWSTTKYMNVRKNVLGVLYSTFDYYNSGIKYNSTTTPGRNDNSYGVSYYDASKFCAQNGARLPSIAEAQFLLDEAQAWPDTYVWAASLNPYGPRDRLALHSDGRVSNRNASTRDNHNGVLCVRDI